jgi:hypothetical protein
MSQTFTNPERLLLALDKELDHTLSLVLYGRSALVLGYQDAPDEMGATKDVDAIIRMVELDALVNDEGFWDARDAVNARFKDEGLYITHLFQEDQVFLRPEWEQHIVPVMRPPTHWLTLFRPHTIDLILTKMMRGNDAQDMQDVAFLIEHDGITLEQMEPAFATVRMPDIQELREAFDHALPIVRQLLASLSA